MTSIQDLARAAAGKILRRDNDVTSDVFSQEHFDLIEQDILHVLEAAVGERETAFIDGLIATLESHGIDATNWDGDDPAHVVVANAIAEIITDLRAQLEQARKDGDVMRTFIQKWVGKPSRDEWLNDQAFLEYIAAYKEATCGTCGQSLNPDAARQAEKEQG